MKKGIFLLMAVLPWLCPTARAQVWCPPGAEWWYEYWGETGSQVGYVHAHYTVDTLVGGIEAQKLEATVTGYDFIAQEAFDQALPPVITSSNEEAVNFWDGDQWNLLFDLSIPPGGQWTLPDHDGNSVLVAVQDSGSVEVGGEWLRYSVVTFTPSFGIPMDTIVEASVSSMYFSIPDEHSCSTMPYLGCAATTMKILNIRRTWPLPVTSSAESPN